MFFSKKNAWWISTLILLFTIGCGAATPPADEGDVSDRDTLLPPNDGSLIAQVEGETAANNTSTPIVTVVAETVEYDADGIEVGFTEAGRPYRGDPDAPVVMEEFSDYQCPFCGRFFAQTFPSLNDNQIANGEVLLIFYDFPLNIHPQAPLAANAARCAGEQGAVAYWEMHDLLFGNISEWSHNQANTVFASYGEALELEMEAFTNCRL